MVTRESIIQIITHTQSFSCALASQYQHQKLQYSIHSNITWTQWCPEKLSIAALKCL